MTLALAFAFGGAYAVACGGAVPWVLAYYGRYAGEVALFGWIAFAAYWIATAAWVAWHGRAWSMLPPADRPTLAGWRPGPWTISLLQLVPGLNVYWWYRSWPTLLRAANAAARGGERDAPRDRATGDAARRVPVALGWVLAIFNTIDHATWWLTPAAVLYLPASAILHILYITLATRVLATVAADSRASAPPPPDHGDHATSA